MSALNFESYTEARAHMKEMLDAAERGQSATVRRGSLTAASPPFPSKRSPSAWCTSC